MTTSQGPVPHDSTTLIRVVVADDHPVMREGLSAVLSGTGVSVVGEASTGREAVRVARELRPNVILMDLTMPDMDGLEATRRIKADAPATMVLVFTAHDEPDVFRSALLAGASGYLVKGASFLAVRQAVLTVSSGESIVDPALLRSLLKESSRAPLPGGQTRIASLTPREQEILGCLVEGLSNVEIAERIHFSLGTVKNAVQRIIEKLEVSDRAQAAVYAVKAGFTGE